MLHHKRVYILMIFLSFQLRPGLLNRRSLLQNGANLRSFYSIPKT